MSKFNRFLSSILAIVMIVTSLPVNTFAVGAGASSLGVYTDTTATTTSSGNGNTAGKKLYFAVSNENLTGYKLQLVFYPLSDKTYYEENNEKRRKDILDEWDLARLSREDSSTSGEQVVYIGQPVYLTRDNLKDSAIQYGFRHSELEYGLGTRKGAYDRNYKNGLVNINVVGTTDVFNTMKNQASNYGKYDFSANLPINVGSKGAYKGQIKDYLMYKLPDTEAKKENKEYIAKDNFVTLVNYLALTGKQDRIYFTETYSNDGKVKTENTVPADAQNIFDAGVYQGKKGEYRLIVAPYYCFYDKEIQLDGFSNKVSQSAQLAATARDMMYLDSVTGDKCTGSIASGFKAVCGASCLEKNDFFNLVGKTNEAEINDTFRTTKVAKQSILTKRVGGGLGIFSSEMMKSGLSNTNIGSITHIFLDENGENVDTASMEYIGKKNEANTITEIVNAALEVAQASQGQELKDGRIYDGTLNRELLLNGTIKIPLGVDLSNASPEEKEGVRKAFTKFGEKVAEKIDTEYSDSKSAELRDAVKTIVTENFGIGEESKLEDMALAIYVLNRFGMDGLDTTANLNSQAVADNITNRWKQILSYAILTANVKSSNTLAKSEGWKGTYSITPDKLKWNNKYGSIMLDENTNNAVNNSASLSEAKTKGLDGATGQITVHNGDLLYKAMEGDNKTSDDRFIRVPIAYGVNPMTIKHVAKTETDSLVARTYVTMPKDWVGMVTESLFKNQKGLLSTDKDSASLLEEAGLGTENKGVLYNDTTSVGNYTGDIGVQSQGYIGSSNTSPNALLSKDKKIVQPIIKGKAFNPVYGEKANANAEIQSTYLNTFGINTYIAVGLARGFEKGIKGTETDKAFNGVVQNLNKINGAGAVIVVPKSVETQVNPEGSSGNNVKAANYTEKYLGYINNLTSNVWVLNSAIAANAGSNSGNLVLAVNNYLLNKGLVKAQSSVGTVENTNTDGEGTKYNLGLQGSYGQSYVIWGKGMPVDALLTTEVDGKIVPLEIATSNFDHSVIPDIWTAVEGVDKLLNVNRYYTMKDKTGKDVTLEVEEAIVKPASVNGDYTDGNTGKDETSYKAFLDKYYEAIKNNNTQDFAVYKNTYTRRTIFDTSILDNSNSNSNGGVTNNVDVYIKTHTGLSDPWRDIIEDTSSTDAGRPHLVEGLVNGINNGLDIVATREDVEAYKNNPSTNRLGVVLKVKIKGDLNQYNMINKVGGTNTTTKVAPETDDKGNYVFKKTIATKNGYATLTPSEGTDKVAKGVGIEYSNGKNDPTATEETKNKSFEDYVTETVLKDVSHSDGDPVQHPAIKRKGVNVTGDNKSLTDTGESLTVPKPNFTPSSIYVKYEEYPPVYEVYRSASGNETIIEKPQVWNTKTKSIDGISDGKDNTPDGGTYIPVSAVANNYEYDETSPEYRKELFETEDGITKLKIPTSWAEVLKDRAYTKEVELYKQVDKKYESRKLHDSQLIGEECQTRDFQLTTGGKVNENSFANTILDIDNLFTGSLCEDKYKHSSTKYAFGYCPQYLASGVVGKVEYNKDEAYKYWSYNNGKDYRVQRAYGEGIPKTTTDGNTLYARYSRGDFAYTTDLYPTGDSLSASRVDGKKPTKYAIYILYVEDPASEAKLNEGVSAFTYLPEDMITRAVTYKDLARQYFQRQQYLREQSAKNTEGKKGSTTYTKKITVGTLEFRDGLGGLLDSIRSVGSKELKSLAQAKLETKNIDIGYLSLVSCTITGNKVVAKLSGSANSGEYKNDSITVSTAIDTQTSEGKVLQSVLNSTLSNEDGTENKKGIELVSGIYLISQGKNTSTDDKVTSLLTKFNSYNITLATTAGDDDFGTKKDYYHTDFTTWYTLYINMCDNGSDKGYKRVNTTGIPTTRSDVKSSLDNKAKGTFFEKEGEDKGIPKYNINVGDETGGNTRYAKEVAGPEYNSDLAGENWGLNGLVTTCMERVGSGENVTTKERKVTVKTGVATGLGRAGEVKAGILPNKAQVSFGMYNSSGNSTPATVGTEDWFSSSKDYTGTQYTIHSDRVTDTNYWRDVYHGYNNYNFYVMVWRGMDKPVLSSAAISSEQVEIAQTQKEAFNGNYKIANRPIGTKNGSANGFYSGTDIGIAPRDKKVQNKVGTSEKMYDTYFQLSWKGTKVPSTASEPFVNVIRWGYETAGGKHIHTNETGVHRIENRSSYEQIETIGNQREDGAEINKIKGKLLVDTYTDAVGVGQSEPTAGELNDLNEFNIKVSDMAYGSDKSELTFYGANANAYKNQWKEPDGTMANLWINLYPFVKMRYQTANQDTGFSEKEGADGETAVTTHDVYVTSKNQSTMLTNDCIDVGINNGVGVTSTSPVSNLLKINSSQWSTHKRSINSKGAGNVLPGGAIYMLNTGSLSSTVDGANRTKIGIRVWQTYLPETTRAMLVSTNDEHRYVNNSSYRTKELNAAKNFYSLSAKNSQAESILQAAMITLNNVDVNLYANDNGTITKLIGGGKYGLKSGQDSTKPSASYSNRYAGNSGYSENGEVNDNIKGNSASIDTTKLLRGEKTYYRVWSTGEKIMFGWLRSNQNTSPTIEQLSVYEGAIDNEHGCLDITNWIDRSTGEVSTGTEDGHAIVYSVNKRTKIVTNFYKMLDLARDTGDGGSKPKSTTYDMPAGNMADGNNMAYLGNRGDFFGSNHTQKGNVYGEMWYGNGVADCGEIETTTKLENYKKMLFAKRILSTSGASTVDTNSVRLGASWINKCMTLQGKQYYTDDKYKTNPNQASTTSYPTITKQTGWYGEACDGIGVVVSSAVIETGFASPIPTGTDTPVRTSIIDPTWTPKHTGNNGTNATYTVFREVFFQTKASSNLVGAVTTNGGYLSQGSVVTTELPDNNDNGVLFNMIINENHQKVRLGKDSNGNQIGFDRLYKSRKFYLPNATVMDLN